MRKYIFILLLILISCERDAKFNADESGRIYLYGILSDSEYNIIKVNVSRPVFGKESARPEDVKLTLEVGSWAGEINKSDLPAAVYVDYVRVYQFDELT